MKKSSKKSNVSTISSSVPNSIIAMGHYNLVYNLVLTDDEMKLFHIASVSDLNTYGDMSFLLENKYLWSRIELHTENKTINTLLFLNRVNPENQKCYIEYLSFELPTYTEDEKEFKRVFKTVNDLNYFFINDKCLYPEDKCDFKFVIRHRTEEKEFLFGNGDPKEIKEEKNEDDKDTNENDIKSNKNIIQSTNEPNTLKKNSSSELEANNNLASSVSNQGEEKNMKESQYSQLRSTRNNSRNVVAMKDKEHTDSTYIENKENVFRKVKLYCRNYDFFLCYIDESIEISPYDDFIEFVSYLKLSCSANIIVHFSDVTENFVDKDALILLNRLFLLTDTFLLENKDALKNWNKHYEAFQTKKNEGLMSEKDIFSYFINTIACRGSLSMIYSKVGFFLDNNFSKLTIIEVPMSAKAPSYTYDIKPYPKLSHTTVDLVDLYKSTLKGNKDFFKAVFYGGLLSKFCQSKNKEKKLEVFHPSYLTGHEILRRILELAVKNLPMPSNPKYFIVKLSKEEIQEYLKKMYLDRKEGKFILDCTNLEKSKMKYYVPLFDYNLHEHFENKQVQRELINKGFVNSKGFVNYDPYYKDTMGQPKKEKKMERERSAHKSLISNQIEANSKNLRNRMLNSVSPTKVRLPVEHCNISEKHYVIRYYKVREKYKCKHGKSNKCQYCDLGKKAKIEETLMEEKRKQMQLRRYDK